MSKDVMGGTHRVNPFAEKYRNTLKKHQEERDSKKTDSKAEALRQKRVSK